MARECVTHHICDCNRERMDALEAALARAVKMLAGGDGNPKWVRKVLGIPEESPTA